MADRRGVRLADTLAAGAWLIFILQAGVGIYLARSYRSTLAEAHSSTLTLDPFAGLHYYASAAGILLFAAALVGMLWTGGHRWNSRWLWWTTLGGLLLSLGIQITGNVLPMSSHDVRTANVEATIAAWAPVIGPSLRNLALQGSEFSQSTLDAWYLLHRWVLPIAATVLLIVFLSLASKRGARPSWLGAILAVAIIAVAAMALGRPPDVAAMPYEYTLGAARPMWYVAPMHVPLLAAQKIWPNHGWIGAMAVPLLVVLVMALLPVLTRKGDGPSGAVRALTSVGFLGFAGLVFWTQPKIQNPFDETQTAERMSVERFGEIDAKLVSSGRKSFLTNRCLDCHKVGKEGSAITGPNLGRVGARIKDPNWYVEMLKNPASKNRDTMPAFDNLKEKELRALAEYLRSLR